MSTGPTPTRLDELSPETRTEIEAAAFRHLVEHLQSRTDVQNIELMNLAGFCRNCLSKWYREGAAKHEVDLELDDVREWLYGMTYARWKADFQK